MTDATSHMLNAGLRTFRNIARVWQLSAAEQSQLLGPTLIDAEFDARTASATVLEQATLRLSALLGIYLALESLLPGRAAGWLRSPNSAPLFDGDPPLDLMRSASTADVINVRRYLDWQLT